MNVWREAPPPDVRRAAAWALGQLEDDTAIDALAAALQHDDSVSVREMSAWALGQFHDAAASALSALATAVQSDRSTDVRSSAAWSIGQIRPERAPSGLVQALHDADDDVRENVAWALGQIRDTTSLPALEKAMQQEHVADVRRVEFRALLLTGEHSERALTEALKSSDAEIREMAVMALAGRGMRPWPMPRPRPRPFP
jgi:HEAT repeat protein